MFAYGLIGERSAVKQMAAENAKAFFPVAKVSLLAGRGGLRFSQLATGFSLSGSTDHHNSCAKAFEIWSSATTLFSNLTGNHVGDLHKPSVRPMVRAGLNVSEGLSARDAKSILDRGPYLPDLSHVFPPQIHE